MSDTAPQPAGWYTDPEDAGLNRYWTGSKWTEDRTPAIAPPSLAPATQPGVQVVQIAKSTTVGVLLWLFLGGGGAHRHYVGKHITAVIQPIVYIAGAIMMWVGLNTQNPGGVGPNMALFQAGALLAGPIALWVLIDVFFIPGWVREWIRVNGRGSVRM